MTKFKGQEVFATTLGGSSSGDETRPREFHASNGWLKNCQRYKKLFFSPAGLKNLTKGEGRKHARVHFCLSFLVIKIVRSRC